MKMMIKKRVIFVALMLFIGAQLQAASNAGVVQKNGFGDVLKKVAVDALKGVGISLGAFAITWKLLGACKENAAGCVVAGYTGLCTSKIADKIIGSKNTLAVVGGLTGFYLGLKYLWSAPSDDTDVVKEREAPQEVKQKEISKKVEQKEVPKKVEKKEVLKKEVKKKNVLELDLLFDNATEINLLGNNEQIKKIVELFASVNTLKVLGSACVGGAACKLLSVLGAKVYGKEATDKITKMAAIAGSAVLAKKMFNYVFPASDHPLGYDPETTHDDVRIEEKETVINIDAQKTVVLDLRPFCGKARDKQKFVSKMGKNSAEKYLKMFNFMGFNFPDTGFKGYKSLLGPVNWFLPVAYMFGPRTYLGQTMDARVVVWHLVKLYNMGHRNIVIFGHSRGGGAGISAAYMFMFPEEFKWEWRWLGLITKDNEIDYKKINDIWASVKALFLANPVLDATKVVAVENFYMPGCLVKLAMTTFMGVSLFEKSQIEKLENIFTNSKVQHVPLFDISLTKADAVVGNLSDDKIEKLRDDVNNSAKLNVCLIENGDHLDSSQAAAHFGKYLELEEARNFKN